MYKRILLLFLIVTCHAYATPPRKRCKFGDACWPGEETWINFNSSLSGRLVRTFPSAAICHGQRYNAPRCNTVKEQWDNSFWRTNQTGAYTAIVWELGNQQCFINSSRSAPCQPGLGEAYWQAFLRETASADINGSPSLLSRSDFCRRCPDCCKVCR